MIKNIFMLIACLAMGMAVFVLAPFFIPIAIGVIIFFIAKEIQDNKPS